jgi:hypothetical protein
MRSVGEPVRHPIDDYQSPSQVTTVINAIACDYCVTPSA